MPKKKKIKRTRTENKKYQKLLKQGQRETKLMLIEFIEKEQFKAKYPIISLNKIAEELNLPSSSIGRVTAAKWEANPTWHTLLAIKAACSKLLGRKVRIREFLDE